MKVREPITFDFFCMATQCHPEKDDLERCNCPMAGSMHHESCGWNYQLNLPVFMGAHPYFPEWDGTPDWRPS